MTTSYAATDTKSDDDRAFLRELRRAALQLVAVIDKHYPNPTEETKRKTLTQTQTK